MKRIAIIMCLIVSATSFASKFQFQGGPCKLVFDTQSGAISIDKACYSGEKVFRLDCTTMMHPDGINSIGLVFKKNSDVQIHAHNSQNTMINYPKSAFGRDLEDGSIYKCDISYNVYPERL